MQKFKGAIRLFQMEMKTTPTLRHPSQNSTFSTYVLFQRWQFLLAGMVSAQGYDQQRTEEGGIEPSHLLCISPLIRRQPPSLIFQPLSPVCVLFWVSVQLRGARLSARFINSHTSPFLIFSPSLLDFFRLCYSYERSPYSLVPKSHNTLYFVSKSVLCVPTM